MKELTVSEWETEIDRSLRFREKFGLEKAWGMLEALYLSTHESQSGAGPNIILSNADTLISGLSVPYPYISIEPRRASAVDKVSVVENVDNMLIDQIRMSSEVKQQILHAYLCGRGILKIGYDTESGWDPRFDEGIRTGERQGLSLTQFDKNGHLIEFGNATPGMPWVSATHPRDILVPWGTRNMETAEYIIHRVIRHVDDVKADPKYDNTKNLKPGFSAEDFIRTTSNGLSSFRARQGTAGVTSGFDLRKNEYVELWEIHDKRTGKLFVIATGHEKFLRNDTNYLAVDGLPFVSLSFVVSPQWFWVTPDAYALLSAQIEAMDITQQAQKIRRAGVLKMLVEEGAMDDEELNKLLSPRVLAAVKVKQGRNLNEVVKFTNPPVDNRLYQEVESVRRNAREMIGYSRNDFGEYEPGGRRTAYEVAKVSQGTDTRQTRRASEVADVYIQTMRKINAILGRFWTTPRLVQALDQDGVAQWQQVTGDYFKSDFAYRVTFSNEGPVNRQVDRQTALGLVQFLAQDPLADPAAVRRFLVRAMNNPEFSSVYPPQVLRGQVNAPLQLPVQKQQVQQQQGPGGGVPQSGGQGG